ncbi:MAG: alanine--tRNA ligase [Thermoplasmata archaeon]|nr:MAG: alanine--tRNA ligase [Thermoplasmata archaeon]
MFEEEYKLEFFKEKGYIRKVCPSCQTGYWTLEDSATVCGDTPCVEYSFIGASPMNRPYSLDEVREFYLKFFEEMGHKRFERYPVIARWRDDVFLTNASIYAFQPFVTGGLIPPPANPLTMSQPCIRMSDLDSVGKTGKHLSSFEMMAHHAFNSDKEEVYWKDKTTRLCHELLTKTFGVAENGIIYKEKPWFGGGNAGPSLEVQVSGLELATLVFMNLKRDDRGKTEIEGELYSPNELRIVDTGYGLERFAWASMATPTIYDAIYPDLTKELFEASGISHELENERYASIMAEHAKLAGIMDVRTDTKLQDLRMECVKRLGKKGFEITIKELNEMMAPIEKVYAIVDHTHTLAFMHTDGIVPSNTKAGYLARLVIRRTLRFMEALNLEYSLSELVLRQIKTFDNILNQELNDVIVEMLDLETKRYHETMGKGTRLVKTFLEKTVRKEEIPLDTLIDFYDTHGIHPRVVQTIARDMDLNVEIPDAFNSIIATRHQSPEAEKDKKKKIYDLPPTKLLYYEPTDLKECDAVVLHSDEGKVILDGTVFYPEGGGQPCDFGVISTPSKIVNVTDVQRYGDVIVHTVDSNIPKGEMVHCSVDWDRRMALTRHQSGTHVILGSARNVLGGHVWQSGAQKGLDQSRVDISHFRKIEEEEIEKIELVANETLLKNIPVEKIWMDRGEAEKQYGFRLYQGGVPIGKKIRVVRIGDFDVEACAGTHVRQTNELGLIKILKTERIQDGVERIIFSAGMASVKHVQKHHSLLRESAGVLRVFPEQLPKTVNRFFEEWKSQKKQIEKLRKHGAQSPVQALKEGAELAGDVKLLSHIQEDADKNTFEELIAIGRKVYDMEKTVAILGCDFEGGKIIIARSKDLDLDCAALASEAGKLIGGGGGGKPEFAQAGGKSKKDIQKAVNELKKKIKDLL